MSAVSELIQAYKNGVVSIRFYIENELVSSGSGFLYKNYLVSNNHVFNPENQTLPASTKVGFRFGDTTQYASDSFSILYQNLDLVVGSTEDAHDYIVYRLPPGVDIQGRHLFELDHTLTYEGQRVLLMGYPFSSKFITSHVGFISAIYERSGVKTLQLDASVNAGNSGGPLIDIESGKVIGIVTRKQTGLSENFDELINSFSGNIDALEASRGMLGLGDIDPIAMLQVSQRQMQHISRDIKRSSNVGIGLAFSTESLESELLE